MHRQILYALGKQTTKTLGLKSEINRRQAEILRDEIIRPINLNPLRSKTEETFERLVEGIFLPMKTEVGEWRENTAKESTREIRSHLIPDLGEIKFEELTPALLRAVLKRKAEQGMGRQVLSHLRGYLWDLLGERERLCFDLVMFAGMRESEAFALWCSDVSGDGIQIERSWYKERYEPPKNAQERTQGGGARRKLGQAVCFGSGAYRRTVRRIASFRRPNW